MTADKHWVDILQALLTPTIAVFGSYIAYQQWRIGKLRYKHELYDRRMAVYEKLMEHLGAIFRDAEFNNEAFADWYKASYEGYFLFDDDMVSYFDTINQKSRNLRSVNRTMTTNRAKENDSLWEEVREKDEQLRHWFEQQFDVARQKFARYLRLEA